VRLKRIMLSTPVLVGACMGCGLLMAQTVTVNPGTEYQVIRGFGGMNGAGWISDLTTAQVNAAFGGGEGQIGLSIMRLRIDPSSSNWSIQVPSAARASALGAKILATPWSAPASMKSNNSLIKGGTLLPASYSAYATHLLDFTTYMSRNSAPIYALSLQNEPDWAPDYESGTWTSSDFINFLTSQGSRLSGQKVVVTESLNSSQALANPILNNAIASNYVSIIGGHLYGVQPKDYPLARSKGKELWMTEHFTDNTDGNAWPSALGVGTELHNSMVANYSAYIWWYIRRSYGLISEDSTVSKRGYVMSQFARFVRPGAVRVGATEKPYSDVYVTAYKGTDGNVTLVVENTGTSERGLTVNVPTGSVGKFTKYSTSSTLNVGYGGSYTVTNGTTSFYVEPQSIATFVGSAISSSSSSSSKAASSSSKASSSSAKASSSASSAKAVSVSNSAKSFSSSSPSSVVLTQTDDHNPIISHVYTADPAVRVINGRVYLMTSHDIDGQTGYSKLTEYLLFSSDDMVNWQDHGVIWKASKDTKWASLAYAPDFIARNGKYYMYFPNGGGSIGVAVADKPEGPYVDPLGKPLISASTTNANVKWIFDPCVFIDDDGQAYLYFGGGGPGNARVIKLNSDMISTSGAAISLDVPNFFEALYMHKKDGVYYLSYSSNPSNGMQISYMTSSSPSSGFTYKGVILPQPWQNDYNNNHASILSYNSQWYIFYHNRAISNVRDNGNVYLRSVNVDRLYYNADGTIKQVADSATGVPQLKAINPFSVTQAELIHHESGIETESSTDGTLDVTMKSGSWIKIAGVNFSTAATGFSARVAGTGTASIQVVLDGLSNSPVGTLAVTKTGSTQTWQTQSTTIKATTGVHDVYLRATGPVNLNWYQFTK